MASGNREARLALDFGAISYYTRPSFLASDWLSCYLNPKVDTSLFAATVVAAAALQLYELTRSTILGV